MKKLTNKKGFTLIELVIVVAVLAILAVIAVPAVGGITEKAKDSTDKASLALYQSALERYNVDKGSYPDGTTVTVLDAVKLYTNQKKMAEPNKGDFYYVATEITISGGPTYYKGQLILSESDPDGTASNIILVDLDD